MFLFWLKSEKVKLETPVLAMWMKNRPKVEIVISNTSCKVVGSTSSEGFLLIYSFIHTYIYAYMRVWTHACNWLSIHPSIYTVIIYITIHLFTIMKTLYHKL